MKLDGDNEIHFAPLRRRRKGYCPAEWPNTAAVAFIAAVAAVVVMYAYEIKVREAVETAAVLSELFRERGPHEDDGEKDDDDDDESDVSPIDPFFEESDQREALAFDSTQSAHGKRARGKGSVAGWESGCRGIDHCSFEHYG